MNRLTKPSTQTLRGRGGRVRTPSSSRRSLPEAREAPVRCSRQYCARSNICYGASVLGGSTPEALAARFTAVAHMWVAEGPGERTERARRKLLSAIGNAEPATLNDVAKVVGRGAPAVSRSVDALVRAGFVERTQD